MAERLSKFLDTSYTLVEPEERNIVSEMRKIREQAIYPEYKLVPGYAAAQINYKGYCTRMQLIGVKPKEFRYIPTKEELRGFKLRKVCRKYKIYIHKDVDLASLRR